MTITKLTANKKIQHIKSVVANIFLYTRKIRSNKQEEDKSMTVTSASIILNEYMQQQQSNNATTVSRSSSGYKCTLVSKSMTTYKEEEDNDDQNSLTSTYSYLMKMIAIQHTAKSPVAVLCLKKLCCC